MQTFLPYKSFRKSMKVLDWRRLGKQRVEAKQILNILLNRTETKGWRNHPITRMWDGYDNALKEYFNICVAEWIDRGYNNNMELETIRGSVEYPKWLGNNIFHSSHRANLLRKDFSHYAKFGWDENPSNPYVWLDTNQDQYYEQHVGTGLRNYLELVV